LALSPDRNGYLLFTSGSTGTPKGVTHSHRNILYQIMTYTNGLQISPEDRLTLLHSHAFSASRLDIFGALLNGAAVCPFSINDSRMSQLARWLRDDDITLMHIIPTLCRGLANCLSDDYRLPALRVIVLGSEAPLARDVSIYRKHFAHSLLVNRYGTTETGNISWWFADSRTEAPSPVPVGFPIPGDGHTCR
jgi:acyl-coenzyme A synthetase/AMP-(fatty) acid ligase